MDTELTPDKIEAQEDIFYGQVVFITARWIIIIGSLFLSLWRAESIAGIQHSIIPVAAIIALNFFLHGRYVMGLRANPLLLKLASALDLLFVTIIVLVTRENWSGIANPFFVFYYPVVLAFALVFQRSLTIVYTMLVAVVYGLVCFMTPSYRYFTGDEEVFAIRVIMLLGTAYFGMMYWRIQRARRREANEA
jgi:hypothetical protein